MGGTLEVLLVSAESIRYTNIIGKPNYFVILEIGNQVLKSKTSKGPLCGHQEIFWNEKFIFDMSRSEYKNEIYLKLKIMDEEIFSPGGFVGETTIYLKGILIEGRDKGFIEVNPSPYNVVLDDDTFQGEINIGLIYTHKDIEETGGSKKPVPEKDEEEEEPIGHSLCRSIANFWQITTLLRFLFRCKSKDSSTSSGKDDAKLEAEIQYWDRGNTSFVTNRQ